MSASALVAQLAAAGTPPDLLAAVAQELFTAEAERRILAERRSNERDRKARSREVTGQDVTARDVTGAVPKESHSNPSSSEPEGSSECETPRPRKADPFPKPEWAEKQVWLDFMANRKRKRLTNSPTAYRAFLADIERLTDDEWPPGRLLEFAAGKGWGSINDPREHRNGNSTTDRQGYRGPRPDPTLALVRAANAEIAAAEGPEDHWRARPALSAGSGCGP